MNLPVIIVGAGGHSKVLVDLMQLQSISILGITDMDPGKQQEKILGVDILGDDEMIRKYSPDAVQLVNGIGSTGRPIGRKNAFLHFRHLGYKFITLIHPAAILSSHIEIGQGCQIMAGSVVQVGTSIGENTIVNTRVSIDHDCYIGAHVHLAPGVTLSGNVHIGDMTHVGTGATIIQGIRIGSNCVVAAGAVVIKDVPDGTIVKGVPGRWENERLEKNPYVYR